MKRLLAAAAVRVETAADIGLARAAAAMGVDAAADVNLALCGVTAKTVRVGNAADIDLAAASWVNAAADLAPEGGPLIPELRQEPGRGGPAVLSRLRNAPGGGKQNRQDEKNGDTSSEASAHGGLLWEKGRSGTADMAARTALAAYGARSESGKVQTSRPGSDILPRGGR